jgi:hypothetical protein
LASFIADAGSDTEDAYRQQANSPLLAAGAGGGSPKRPAAAPVKRSAVRWSCPCTREERREKSERREKG